MHSIFDVAIIQLSSLEVQPFYQWTQFALFSNGQTFKDAFITAPVLRVSGVYALRACVKNEQRTFFSTRARKNYGRHEKNITQTRTTNEI
jgi:hypothetical protein